MSIVSSLVFLGLFLIILGVIAIDFWSTMYTDIFDQPRIQANENGILLIVMGSILLYSTCMMWIGKTFL